MEFALALAAASYFFVVKAPRLEAEQANLPVAEVQVAPVEEQIAPPRPHFVNVWPAWWRYAVAQSLASRWPAAAAVGVVALRSRKAAEPIGPAIALMLASALVSVVVVGGVVERLILPIGRSSDGADPPRLHDEPLAAADDADDDSSADELLSSSTSVDSPGANASWRHETLVAPDGTELDAIVVTPPADDGLSRCVVYLCGNSNTAENAAASRAPKWTERGATFVALNYRSVGRSGDVPSCTGLVLDAATAIAFAIAPVEDHGLGFAPHDVLVLGHSLGGALAVVALASGAAGPRARGVALVADRTFSSLSAAADALLFPHAFSRLSTPVLDFVITHVAGWRLDVTESWRELDDMRRVSCVAATDELIILDRAAHQPNARTHMLRRLPYNAHNGEWDAVDFAVERARLGAPWA